MIDRLLIGVTIPEHQRRLAIPQGEPSRYVFAGDEAVHHLKGWIGDRFVAIRDLAAQGLNRLSQGPFLAGRHANQEPNPAARLLEEREALVREWELPLRLAL